MKTTVELPDKLLKEIKQLGAKYGFSMREFITQAVLDRLRRLKSGTDKPWMRAFGTLSHLHAENERVRETIKAEFERVDPEAWQ